MTEDSSPRSEGTEDHALPVLVAFRPHLASFRPFGLFWPLWPLGHNVPTVLGTKYGRQAIIGRQARDGQSGHIRPIGLILARFGHIRPLLDLGLTSV